MGNSPSKKDKPTTTSTSYSSTTTSNPAPTTSHTSTPSSNSTSSAATASSGASRNRSEISTSTNTTSSSTQSKPSDSAKKTQEPGKPSKLDELFEKYRDPDSVDSIGPNGVEQLCQDLSLDPESILVLVLAWHLKAQTMGYFTKKEFVTGLSQLGVDSIPKLQSTIQTFNKDLDNADKFRDIYRYAFTFAKEKENKILELESACAMLSLILTPKYPHVQQLIDFLQNHQKSYRGVNSDQWLSIFEFMKLIHPDGSNYDENGAWPVMLDEYVTWVKSK
ncbi:hypothetical protein SAMD00019534_072710 [Acytostelium subglobosum LB1]|uniref:hypothetical protein n=1 Tax=Acytostelium subglobosum LB1 TaxID=1410327 RepID=UPI000644F85C|nr:hypothetical protein SAMD00019534_072710 [Acytostelium subglobosum LB1]GAM24096.1 hypothetical protein SAMD00019534_072710 [Acytostelium subglobosum LB1]|eukprot:XP_012753132.1 hypothetical protein SAMD00019534_072710 [Acytostelium subglobosum LB1]